MDWSLLFFFVVVFFPLPGWTNPVGGEQGLRSIKMQMIIIIISLKFKFYLFEWITVISFKQFI